MLLAFDRALAEADVKNLKGPAAVERTAQDDARLRAVVTFAQNILEKGRDVYDDTPTPLFVDGINVDTGAPVTWRFDGDVWIISNMANQQNLFRTLTGLTNLRGEPKYKDAAKAAIAHMFAHHRSEYGLLYWGGHQFVDLKTKKNVGRFDAMAPLALLTLEAALRGEYDPVPAFNGGRGYIHGRFDGLGRTRGAVAIWSATR